MQATNLKIIHLTTATPYEEALVLQENMVQKVIHGDEQQALFMCEHAPVYTCGTSTQIETDYLGGNNIPVVKSGRGGRITYHGPGQRVIYPIVDLKTRGRDLKKYIHDLQNWLIDSLGELGIEAHTDDDVGIWVKTNTGDKKIAAIGVRVRKWVTFHGIALNINPNMDHFKAIVPCGIQEKGITSLTEQGVDISLNDLDTILLKNFQHTFS